MRTIPFRDMRQTLALAQAQIALLLAVPGMEWSQNDYIMLFAMNEMWRKEVNPTRRRMVGIVGAYLRHYRKLIAKLPEGGEMRENMQAEWDKLAEPYKNVIEERVEEKT